MNIYEVLKRPIMGEKADRLQDENNQYVFEVDKRANKRMVKEAIEKVFDVHVLDVHIINMPPKRKRYGRRVSVRKPGWKKAIVTLAEGESITMFEGV
jgi:large subunit ribosomal protein L23